GTSGSQLVSGSGSSLPAGSWVRYNWLDFGAGQYEQCRVHLQWASPLSNNGTAIEIRLDAPDGTLIGAVPCGQNTCRIATTSGIHDVFLVFPNENVQAVDWFIFNARVIWTGNGADNNWSTATNWSGTVADGTPLYFGPSSRNTPSNDFAAVRSFASLGFDAGSPAYTLVGNGIALTGDIVNSSTNNQTINVPVTLSGMGAFSVDTGSAGVTLSGGLSGTCGGLNKSGSGTLTLPGAIVCEGDMVVADGTLAVAQVQLANLVNIWIGTTNGANAVLNLDHNIINMGGKLYIDGVQMPDGTYGSSASSANNKIDSAFSGTGMLTVQSGPCPPAISTRADGHTVAKFSIAGSGTWTVPAGVTHLEVLVVGGGGGAGAQASGAGAGGLYYTASYSVVAGNLINVTVGAGGAGGLMDWQPGTHGSNSVFGTIVAFGGKATNGDREVDNMTFASGGSQGGYSTDGGVTTVPGTPGFTLNNPVFDGAYFSGSGAGAAGTHANNAVGGIGVTNAITGEVPAPYYAGGGGALESASGSLGGGGKGGNGWGNPGEAGAPNTGGGGGGGHGGAGGYGGSGVIIVAYESSTTTTYTVSFDSNDGSPVAAQYLVPDATATEPAPAPTRTGYTFVEWCPDSMLTNAFNFSTPITTNTTLYAKWTIRSYTLTYSAGSNGTIDGTTPQTVAYLGTGTAVTAVPCEGYRFLKWSDNKTANPRTDSNVSNNITVTARFELPSTDTISPTAVITRGDGKTVATFTSGSGTWTIPAGVTDVEVLVVGGGGGSWNDSFQSGAGAGGMHYSSSYAVTPGSVGITVGAGATDGTGSSSHFGTQLIAYGGTKGNGYTDGGDQGGYSLNGGTTVVAGNPGYHYSPMDGNWCSGGGAGHEGYKGDVQLGGTGAVCRITGSAVHYAGGGGAPSSYSSSGGTGHNLGGGGSGPAAFGDRSFSGLANTGGGGGGGWGGGGGAGGSGAVIVAYRIRGGTVLMLQ
ncbi:MAG: glycine-rich domain-containing protein, partial [bacterium]